MPGFAGSGALFGSCDRLPEKPIESIPSVFRNAKSVSPAVVSSPVAGSRLASPNWCVPVAFRPAASRY